MGKRIRGITILVIVLLILVQAPMAIAGAPTQPSYRSRQQIISGFLAFEGRYPGLIAHEIIGRTVLGYDIYLFKIGNPNGGKVLIDAAIHGDEQASTEAVYWVVDWLLKQNEDASVRILQRNYIFMIPIVNYDQYGSSRYNAHGVDLNRNFETGWGKFNDYPRGPYPLSEPETAAVHNFFSQHSVSWYLNLHTGDYRITPPWSSESYVPESAYFKQTYDKIYTLSKQRNVSPISYVIRCNYGGGTARDEGYHQGAYTYAAELTYTVKPQYSRIQSEIVPKLIPVVITICQECEIEIQYELGVEVSGSGTTNATGIQLFNAGTAIAVQATADPGWTLSHWMLNNTDMGSANPYQLTMNANYNLTAVFIEVPQYQPRIDWYSPVDATQSVNEGSSLNFMQVSSDPNGGALAYSWTLDSIQQATTQNWTYTPDYTSQGTHTVRITVSDGSLTDYQEWTVNVVDVPTETRDLTIVAAANGNTDPHPGTYPYGLGSDASVLAIPDAGYILSQWLLDGAPFGSANPYVVTMNDNYELQPVFVAGEYTLTVNVVGSGTVTKNPDQPTYTYGTDVTLTADPADDWAFSGWSGDASGTGLTTIVDMTEDKEVTATFVPVYDLVITVDGEGTTNPAPGTYEHPQGPEVVVDALPDAGFELSHWLLNGTNVGATDPYTVTINGNRNLTAVFAAAPTSTFEDGFESGNTNAWDSTTATTGETVAASSEQAHQGIYSLKSTSNGGGGTESARVNKAFSPTLSEIHVRGYFKLTQNGIVENSDRIKLIEIRAGSTIIASAGLWQSGGTLRWWMETRSGTSWVETYTTQVGSFDLTQWFSMELYWKLGATGGGGTLWVNGNQIYQISNADTDNYGSCSALRFGLAELTGCGSTTLYSDLAVVSAA